MLFYLATVIGGVCGTAAAVGFIIRRPQTPLAATRPTSWATTGGRLALFTNMCQGVAR